MDRHQAEGQLSGRQLGQHTIAARKLLNKGEDLPVTCKVYYGLTEQEEALLFAQQFGIADVLTAGTKDFWRQPGGASFPECDRKCRSALGLCPENQ
ncbi:MAG: hypothetical protein LUC30_07610 [Clostridiales bacterium]|nr:hypothetical protein [Clostridiales bacterium]